ncbi:MAG TPA: hypothetical protein VIY73_01000 [Polyangiaceae bacterium]
MAKGMGLAIGVWAAAIVSAVVVVHQVVDPMRGTPADRVAVPHDVVVLGVTNLMPADNASAEAQGSEMVMPMDTIIGHVPAAVRPPRANDVVIGPGTVTHPAEIPPRQP